MSDQLVTIVGAFVGVAAIIVVVVAVVYFRTHGLQLQGDSPDRLAAAAAAHGWHFEHSRQIGKVRRAWSGTTDGVAWTAEHVGLSDNSADDSYRQHTFRWRTALANGPVTPLVLVHERSSLQGVDSKTQELPALLRGVASAAIDRVAAVYFGPAAADVDLSSWVAIDGHALPGMRVLAPSQSADGLFTWQRIAPPLGQASASLASGGEPPAILIQRDQLHLASRSDPSAADVERAVTLGAAIARALAARA
jgi:hypothetical protein